MDQLSKVRCSGHLTTRVKLHTHGGVHGYPTFMQRPGFRRTSGRYSASKSVDGSVGCPGSVCEKRDAQCEYDPAQATLLASPGWKASALRQPAGHYANAQGNRIPVGQVSRRHGTRRATNRCRAKWLPAVIPPSGGAARTSALAEGAIHLVGEGFGQIRGDCSFLCRNKHLRRHSGHQFHSTRLDDGLLA